MRKGNMFIGGLLLCVALSLPLTARGDTLLDTGTPTGTTARSLKSSYWWAGHFTAEESWFITSVKGFMRASASWGTVSVSLYEGTSLPEINSALASTEFLLANEEGGWYGPEALSWSLTPGEYWIAFETRGESLFSGTMKDLSGGTPLDRYARWTGGASYLASTASVGMRIEGRLVPEPSSSLLFLSGIPLFIRRTIKQRPNRSSANS